MPTLPPLRAVGSAPDAMPAGKTVLSGRELRSVAGSTNDPMKALQTLPGIAVPDDRSGTPAIRGSRPTDNAYYIDDLPVGYLFHAGGLVSTVHGDLVRQFDLYSAAFGPEYGDVTGAVLDVALRAPRTDRLGGKLNVGLLGADLLVEGPVTDNQSFYFAVKRSYIDLVMHEVTDDDSGVILSMPRYNDYQGKYLWRLGHDHLLTFHATGASDKMSFRIPGDAKAAQQDPVLAGGSAIDMSYGTQALVWDAEFGHGAANKLALGHTRTTQSMSIGSAVRVDAASDDLFLREQLRLRPAEDHEVSLGGSLRSVRSRIDLDLQNAHCTEFDAGCDLTSAERAQTRGLIEARLGTAFVKDRWQFARDWALNGGLHHTTDSYLHRQYTEPRVGLEWKWSDATLLTAGWGRHNQFPSAEQALKDIGNLGLWHLRATHSVVGLSQKLGDGWSWRAEAYHKRFSDLVVSDPLLNYVNGASGKANGLELLVKKDAATGLSGWLSVSLSRARRRNDSTGEQFPFEFDQPVIISLVGNYKLSDAWTFGGRWSYHTGQPDTPVVGTGTYPDGRVKPLYGPLNSERLPSYHRLDLRAERTVSPTLKYHVEVINAYGRKNVSGYSYAVDYSSRKPVTQMPMMLSFGVEVGF